MNFSIPFIFIPVLLLLSAGGWSECGQSSEMMKGVCEELGIVEEDFQSLLKGLLIYLSYLVIDWESVAYDASMKICVYFCYNFSTRARYRSLEEIIDKSYNGSPKCL